MRKTDLPKSGHGSAVSLDEPSGNRVGRRDSDLLADDRTHASFNRTPSPWRAKPGSSSEQRADGRVARKVSGWLVQAEVKVRDPASASDQMNQLLPMRQVGDKHEVIVTAREELDSTGIAVDEDRAPVGSSRDMLDAGDRPCCEI